MRHRHPTLIVCFGMIMISCGGCRHEESQPGIVIGSSMAPTLLGEHLLIDCPQCQFEFACDTEQAQQRKHLVCPNCGYTSIRFNNRQLKPAQSVNILTAKHPLDRFDVVAFNIPETGEAGVKRIVGMPGESITIREGNLFVDNQLVRKTLKQQKSMRIPVYDSRHQIPDNLRWVHNSNADRTEWVGHSDGGSGPDSNAPEAAISNWQLQENGFRFEPAIMNSGMEWMGYRQRRGYSHLDRDESKPIPIEDSYGFNQSLSRDLNPLDELMIQIEMELGGQGVFGVRFVHRSDHYEFRLDAAERSLTVVRNGDPITVEALDPVLFAKPNLRFEFSSIDQQILIALDRDIVYHRMLPASADPVSPIPLAIGAKSDRVELHRIRIWRDLFYLPAREKAAQQTLNGEKTGYLLLGDNVPLSIDSRHWTPASVPSQDVIGEVELPIAD